MVSLHRGTMVSRTSIYCGIDEVGRGALAGPVFACAVVLPASWKHRLVRDSKTLTSATRERISQIIMSEAVDFAVGFADVNEIDRLNILNATLLAMARAFDRLRVKPKRILVDGLFYPPGIPAGECVPKADERYAGVSAASILAKVERDRLMVGFSKVYPSYAFDRHKGYPTRQHLAELKTYGPTEIHRMSFKPVKLSVIQEDARGGG